MQKLPPPLQILEKKVTYEGYFEVQEQQIALPCGLKKTFSLLYTQGDAVVVLAETLEKKILVIQEYRLSVGQWIHSLPGGSIDPGEDPLKAAQRELLEETGFSAEAFIVLGSCYPFPAICSQKVHYILAKNATLLHPPQKEPFEFIEGRLLTLQELEHEITENSVDGMLCAALALRALGKPLEADPFLST